MALPAVQPAAVDWTTRVAGSNIHPRTLLATDYLNHFNEVVMLLEMLPGMPEGLDDLAAWHPKSYVEHFEGSRLTDRHLIIEAFHAAPRTGRDALTLITDHLTQLLLEAVDTVLMAMASGQPDLAHEAAQHATHAMKPLIRQASDVINGATPHARATQDAEVMSQDNIDSLFA